MDVTEEMLGEIIANLEDGVMLEITILEPTLPSLTWGDNDGEE